MNIKLDIDATPQELRSFFGLPDLEPIQREWLAQVQARMREGMQNLDPTKFFGMDPSAQMKAFETLQQHFWQHLTGTQKSGG